MYKINLKTSDYEKVLEFAEKNKNTVEILGYYDIEERLEKEVARLGSALEELKNGGISMDFLRSYLKGKGISMKLQNAVMGELNNFFREVGYYTPEKEV